MSAFTTLAAVACLVLPYSIALGLGHEFVDGVQELHDSAGEQMEGVRFGKEDSGAGDLLQGEWPPVPVLDSRYIASSTNSVVMLTSAYLDQPYCVVAPSPGSSASLASAAGVNGSDEVEFTGHRIPKVTEGGIPRWVCVVTADQFHEGGSGEQIVSIFSDDCGKSWSEPVVLEPGVKLANAYSTIAITDFGRIYAMYNFNADNITTLPDGKPLTRTDELGHFVMKYSDDRGLSWSKERYEIPYRITSIDQHNTWEGKVRMMWSVDQCKTSPIATHPASGDGSPIATHPASGDGSGLNSKKTLYYSFTKIGGYAYSPPEEVWFLASENIMTEKDPSKVEWKLLPDGDHGLPPPGGNPNIAEEGHIMPMPNGMFYAVFRTTQGLLAACSTVGKSASEWRNCSAYFAEYHRSISPDKPHYLKNPRGPITMKQFSNGGYLLLYYNNGDTGFLNRQSSDDDDDEVDDDGGPAHFQADGSAAAADNSRNPYWLAAGQAHESGVILWSQPEIVIYDRVPTRPGYPDFLEIPSTGQIFITETQKTTARVHEINSRLLEKLWKQHNSTALANDYAAEYKKTSPGKMTFPMADLPIFGNYTRQDGYLQGFTFILWLLPLLAGSTETLVTSYEHDYHKGLDVVWGNNTINFTVSDNYALASCSTDSVCASRLRSVKQEIHQLAVTVDNGPMMVSLAVDGVLCDGGGDRVRGQCWMDQQLRDVNGLANATVGYTVQNLLLYNRALFNSEVVANYNHYAPQQHAPYAETTL